MKIIYTEKEVLDMLAESYQDLAPEGHEPVVKISNYNADYCTITFNKKENDEPTASPQLEEAKAKAATLEED